MRSSFYLTFFTVILLVTGCAREEIQAAPDILPEDLAKRIQQSKQYDPEIVTELEHARRRASDPMDQAAFDLLIAGRQGLPGSPVEGAVVRGNLEKLADSFPGTWISALAKLTIAGVHLSSETHRERLDLLQELLADPGLHELGDNTNPFLAPFHHDEESMEAGKNPMDLVRFLLVAVHSESFDLSSAETTAEQILSPYWRGQAAPHLDRLRAMNTEDRQRARERLLDTPVHSGLGGDSGSRRE